MQGKSVQRRTARASVSHILFFKKIAEHYIATYNLKEHTGDAQAEILDTGGETRMVKAFEHTARNLIAEHHANKNKQVDT